MFVDKPSRYVVVTGASSGIGRATAEHLAREGFGVFAGVRSLRDAQRLRDEGLETLSPLLIDVTDSASVERARAEVEAAVGERGLAGLVNNAGVSLAGPLEYIELDEIRDCFEVNVFGVLTVTRAFLPLLRRGGGRIVNMSSGIGRVAMPLVGPYCASKFALEALSDALSMELRRSGVGVSVIEPGFVATPLLDKGNEKIDRKRDSLPSEAPSYYRDALGKLRAQFDEAAENPTRPESVARVVGRALTVASPRKRYAVGVDATVLMLLGRVLPDRVKHRVFGRMVGL
jgi:NAD(P)-dependent dehydrogenase (short-subunit alcohol dehydrogenase family)